MSVTLTPGPATLTLTTSEPLITLSGSFAITEPADAVADAAQPLVYRNFHWQIMAEPPPLAESLLCIFARTTRVKDIDALMGDFEELFARDCASGMSKRRADTRYWSRVIRSIRPQLWQAFRRLGLFGLIAALLRR